MKKIQSWISHRRPWMFENSLVPKILSYFAPISIWAISFGPFVWCRGLISPTTKRHETIHYHQQIELLFIFHWILYLVFYLKGLITERSGKKAYRHNPFELEAYDNEFDEEYLENRSLYAWRHYI